MLADQAACLEIYDSNAERFFSPGDRDQFLSFVESPPGFFGVLCDDAGRVLGCGGIGIRPGTRDAVLMWGMIHAAWHGKGLGRLLLQERLRRLTDMPDAERVVLHTSGETIGFYRRQGFRIVEHVPDDYRPGLDRYTLELRVRQ
jgi:ribosomal protein S18 acetylase RimI-like enzyme